MRFTFPIIHLCRCGSGEPCRELRDAHGIFCGFVCDACEERKRAEFDPRIFTADPYPADEPIEGD